MLDPTLLDPSVMKAAKAAGLNDVQDLNHNGKIDIQDVALTQANVSNTPAPQIVV